jgi:tetratricopeptide (TPR) repeat protein
LVQKLADRGLQAARALVAMRPDSAEAQYLLGSWLIYGYRVVESETVSFDATGGEHREKTQEVAQGLADSPAEGLKALESAHALAPQNGRYFVDYGAALYDCDRPEEAMSVLKKVWLGTADLTLPDKVRTALLMSDLLADQGEVSEAREWVYRALSLDPKLLPVVPRLRRLDRLQTEALTASPESVPSAEEEVAPGEPETTEEVAPEESEEATEAGPGLDAAAPEVPEESNED